MSAKIENVLEKLRKIMIEESYETAKMSGLIYDNPRCK